MTEEIDLKPFDSTPVHNMGDFANRLIAVVATGGRVLHRMSEKLDEMSWSMITQATNIASNTQDMATKLANVAGELAALQGTLRSMETHAVGIAQRITTTEVISALRSEITKLQLENDELLRKLREARDGK